MKNIRILLMSFGLILPLLVTGTANSLFVGVGDFSNSGISDLFEIDLNTNGATGLGSVNVHGMAANSIDNIVYFTSTVGTGTTFNNLYEYNISTSTLTQVSVITNNGAEFRVDGLGYYDGTLYGWAQFEENGVPIGLYSIDIVSGVAILLMDGTAFGSGISGIDIDPLTGIVYGVDDNINQIVQINHTGNTMTNVASYPAGISDVDGLAIDDQSNLYLVDDQGTDIQIYNLVSSSYTGTIPSPIGINATFSGGAAIFCPPPTTVPTMGEWGLIVLALLVLSFGTVFMMRHQTAIAGMGETSMSQSSGIPFDRASYGKMLIVVMIGLVAVFVVSVLVFGYEMTNADVPGSLIAGPIAAYLLHLLFGKKK